ncbi:MAG UNVERIFIED_CONTAM: hypothetical protein LVR18_48730 [Planctomycetaceae bacterium]
MIQAGLEGVLWLLLSDVAKSCDVSTSTIQAWRRRPDWKPRFEGISRWPRSLERRPGVLLVVRPCDRGGQAG